MSPPPTTSRPQAQGSSPRHWRGVVARMSTTFWGRVQLAAIALLTVIIVLVLVLLLLWKNRPDYWTHNRQLLASDNATLQQLAGGLEQRTLRDLSGTPEDTSTTRTLHLSFDEVNAWINVKLEDYLANRNIRLPRQIRHPMVAGKPGRMIVAFEYESGSVSQVMSFELEPVFSQDRRQFRVKLRKARAGALPLPIRTLRNQVAKQSPQAASQLDELFDAMENRWMEAVQNHPGDARMNLRLTNIVIDEQGLELTLQSEPRPPKESNNPAPSTEPAS